jgi:aminopeptidase N
VGAVLCIIDRYFDRHDGDAATIEDWLQVFEDATGRDLTQFKHWYTQAGTPHVTVTDDFKNGTYTLTLEQKNHATPGQKHKDPKVIPMAVGLLNPNGDEVVPTTVLELTKARQSFSFEGLSARPTPSILRGFSAPVVLSRATTPAERAFLLAHDTDAFNKWEAGRALAKEVLIRKIVEDAPTSPDWLAAIETVTFDDTLDPAFRALTLRLAGEDDLAQTLFAAGHVPDPAAIHAARAGMLADLAQHLGPRLPALIDSLATPGPFDPGAVAAGKRALRLGALSLQSRLDGGKAAVAAFEAANAMTEQMGALAVLLDIGQGAEQIAAFRKQWQGDRLVMDKWFALQVSYATPDATAATTNALTQDPDFDWKNPNRFRAVIASLAGNHAGFHHASGDSYTLLADWLIKLDPVNPQTAARMSTAFETWPRYDADRQAMMRGALLRIQASPTLSRNLGEMVERMLAA